MLIDHVERYLALRRATGFKLTDPERVLRSFARRAWERGEDHVRTEIAIAWAAESTSQFERHRRLITLVRFAEFLHAEDAFHEIPPRDLFRARHVRPIPYIFSEDEIARLIATTAKLQPVGSLRPRTFSTLFGLMAVTGLRRKEAIELRLSDFTGDGLRIRQTKFRKSRFVPLHSSTIAQVNGYLEARRLVSAETDHLFVSLRRRKLAGHTVLTTFHKVCEEAGIGRTSTGSLPRLHDLRHAFTVRAMKRCLVNRDQVNRHMLALTTYLGHARVESTYWYLESTPQLLHDIACACESFTTGGQT
jgi:integrase/recombinase XerD